MHSPFVSLVGRVVILCSCVLCFLESTKLCIYVQPRSCAQVWVAPWVGLFPLCVSVTPCSMGGKSSVPAERSSDLTGGRIAHGRWCECVLPKTDRLVTGNTDGTECWLCLRVLHTFGNGCCWSRAVWKDSDSLPYVQCLFLARPQLWASCPVLGRLNKPGFLCLKVLDKDFGKLAFKSQCFFLLKPSF